MEELVKYYDTNFKLIDQKYRLTDKDKKTLKRNKSEFDFREHKYSIYKNQKDCFAGYHIQLNN